ncbi:hypothetical protein V6N11_048087 [Hibiscus sabdariffa]|uniref:Uncharacterized protein n=1 Tax=Hibiscus sabdariffa TaxID=183260 RepID=A0ABR2NRM8_9ROSI
MDMKSVQIDDGETHDPSLAGDVKFGLIRMLLSPKLATKTAVVRTFTNIGWRRRLKFFRGLGHEIEIFPHPKDMNATTTPYGPWMRAPTTPYQRWEVVYCQPMVIKEASVGVKLKDQSYDDASSTQQNLPSLQVSTAIEQTPNSGIGISDKELDELAKIADELRVNPSLFVASCAAPTVVVD